MLNPRDPGMANRDSSPLDVPVALFWPWESSLVKQVVTGKAASCVSQSPVWSLSWGVTSSCNTKFPKIAF